MKDVIHTTVASEEKPVHDLVVHYDQHYPTIGIGFVPQDSRPQMHFVDIIYGNVPTQTEIGRILRARLAGEPSGFGRRVITEGDKLFENADEEAEFNNLLGRVVLDAVTGSKAAEMQSWGWFDRGSVNRLIRILRKARDVTFGRDE